MRRPTQAEFVNKCPSMIKEHLSSLGPFFLFLPPLFTCTVQPTCLRIKCMVLISSKAQYSNVEWHGKLFILKKKDPLHHSHPHPLICLWEMLLFSAVKMLLFTSGQIYSLPPRCHVWSDSPYAAQKMTLLLPLTT